MKWWPLKLKGEPLLVRLQLLFGSLERRRSSEFAGLFAQVREAELNLVQASRGLEAQFLATSSELESLAGFGDQFVKQVETLVSLATGKGCDDSVFSGAIRLIDQSTQFLVGCQEQTVGTLELLRTYNAQIGRLLAVETQLQRTMLPLRFVPTLFKAESAPLGSAVQQMFTSLTHEIEGLHAQVQEIFGTKFKQLEQTRRTVAAVIAQLDRQSQSLHEVTTTHKAQIESSIETLKKEMTSNHERDVRLGVLSKDIAREVEQIVMGLQFQDIINQKLQHVTAAFPQIEAKFTEFNTASNQAQAREPLHFLEQSCRLEAGQLQGAEGDLANAEAAIQGGIQKVLAQLTEMDSHCLSLEEFKLLTTSFDGMIQVLVEMIEEVRDLVGATVASAAEAYEVLRPLGGLASGLTAIIRDLSARIRLIGLNAQVQAARAAQDRRGAGLEVLSARTSEISEETNRISVDAASQLDALAAGLAESVNAFGKLQTTGLTQQDVLNQQGRTEERRLHAFRDSALETLRAIGDSLDQLRAQAQRTLATVQFSEFRQSTLPALRLPLIAIADGAQRWVQARGGDQSEAILVDGFKRNYTMASEREVFASVVSARSSPSAPLPSERPVANSEFEAFTEPPADKEGEPASVSEPALQTASERPAPASPNGSDLGANVELF